MTNSPIPINENYETYNQISDNLGIIEYSMHSGDNQEQESFDSKYYYTISNSDDSKKVDSKPFINNNVDKMTLIPTRPTDETNKNDKIKEKIKKGRKRKNSNDFGKHNKYSFDNICRKIKSKVLHFLYLFINDKIVKMKKLSKYKIKRYTLKKISQKQIVDCHAEFNKDFLQRTLKDIFIVNISTRNKKREADHNKKIIENLLNSEKDVTIKDYFNSLFNLSFLDCLKHFRETEKNIVLEGMITFGKCRHSFLNDDLDYINTFDYYMINYEKVVNNKKSKKRLNLQN